jgi:hypothetical protein
MDSKIPPRPDTPRPDIMPELRTPSYSFNHGGLYAPADPRECDTPCGPCEYCQDRIDAAEGLVLLSQSCCGVRPDFLEPCPKCNAVGSLVTHAEKGVRCCNGCEDRLCIRCFAGARYFCPLRRRLSPPGSPLARQEALGVQSPEAEEKGENK